ncbi:MAG: CoA pyrophosphatase [Balneola sp.]|nr:MAG: CoA pyrophosphatase [Balneola sp.]
MRPYPAHLKNPSFKSNNVENGNYRNSSVLVPITSWTGELELILTLRTSGIKHGGQLSFPGGGKEGNETFEQTALRESREEIGISENEVSVVGNLTPLYVNHSNNMVTPVVGFIDQAQDFRLNPNEVDEVFTVSLSELASTKNRKREEWQLRDTPYIVPFWDIHRVPLWGATAMMISELLELYREYTDQ